MSDEFTGMFNGTSKYQEEIKNFCTVVSCEIARKYKVFVSSDDIRTEIHEKIKKQIECVKKNSKHIIPIISFDIPKEGRFHILIQPMNFWDGKKGYDYYFDTVILEAEPREYVKVGGCPKCCCFKQDAIIDSNNNKKCIVVTKSVNWEMMEK